MSTTFTLEGSTREEWEQLKEASRRGCRIEVESIYYPTGWRIIDSPAFDSPTRKYRIHPDDLHKFQPTSTNTSTPMNTPIHTTKEKILEAAAKCSTAKETLKVLFPEVFVTTLNLKALCIEGDSRNNIIPMDKVKKAGFAKENRLLYYSTMCENNRQPDTFLWLAGYDVGVTWEMEKTPGGNYLLIPTKKTP